MRVRVAATVFCFVATHSVLAQVCLDPDAFERMAAMEACCHVGRMEGADRSGPTRGYDVRYHRLELVIDPSVRAVQGVVTHHIEALLDLESVVLDLSNALDVDSVKVNDVAVGFTHAADKLTLLLLQPIAEGELAKVTIAYGGVPDEGGFGSFVQAEHAGAPIIWTLSEPYGARDWWPCKQDLSDKADSLDLIVTTTAGNRAAGNGVLIAEDDLGNGLVRYHWRHRHPIAYYLIAVAVTNYTVFSQQVQLGSGTVEVLNYCYPEDLSGWQGAATVVAEQMQLYSELFGDYPFADEKYGHAQFGWGGGMEHQTMSFMGSLWYELVAHELAHQWFGDLITCGSWKDIWLNEGFATYLQMLCYERIVPQYWLPVLQARNNQITSQPGGSVLVTDTLDVPRLFDVRLTYAKGSYLLHMLRWVCGDEAFFQGVNDYLNDPALRNKSAVTDQLVAHLEAASGRELDGFMADWYSGQGYPSYTLTWAQAAGGKVQVRIEQSTSHPSVEFFEMPLPVRFVGEGHITDVVLEHDRSGQEFALDLPFQADSALIDPDLWIVTRSNLVLKVPVAAFTGMELAFVYPNPATGDAWLHVGTSMQGNVRMEVIDPTGRLVHLADAVAEGLRMRIPSESFAPGHYTVRISDEEGKRIERRFVKG